MAEYEKMKDTGIFWIPRIPEHWKTTNIKRVCSQIGSGTTPNTGSTVFYGGEINWIQSGDLYYNAIITSTKKTLTLQALTEYTVLKIYEPSFIVIAMYGASIGNVAISNISACVNQACCVLKPTDNMNIRFLYYWLSFCKNDFINKSDGGTQPNISQAKVKNEFIVVPPRAEQDAIVRFLDWKVSEINKLIAIRRKEIQELEELKKSVINTAVTKGLDKSAKMKSSGVSWLGDIPEGWEVKKLKNVSKLNNTKVSNSNDWYIGMENIESGNGKYIATVDIIPESICNKFEKDDILFGKLRPYLAKVYIAPKSGICSSEFLILKSIKTSKKFLFYVLLSHSFIDLVNSSTYGAKMPRASWNFIGNCYVPFPPLSEQNQIADFLDSKCQTIDSSLLLAHKKITALQELKSVIISDAVTGRIDVRNVSVPEYEHVSDTAECGEEEESEMGEDAQ